MGKMQDNLREILRANGSIITKNHLPHPTRSTVASSQFADEVFRVYRALGGISAEYPMYIRNWDIEADGIAIELDEALHFNRYRLFTLQSPAYTELHKFPLADYQKFCREHEQECLTRGSYGGFWSNPSCERQFGAAAPFGSISDNGSPRWKQRAFYDFVKDLAPVILGVPVVRLSIWDRIQYKGNQRLLSDVLEGHDIETGGTGILDLLRQRKPL